MPKLEGESRVGSGAVRLLGERPVEAEDRADIGQIRIVARQDHELRSRGNGWRGGRSARRRPPLEQL